MGRVSRYKKLKACDPFSRANNGGRSLGQFMDRVGVWGLGDSGRKPKKRSLVAQRWHAAKQKRKGGGNAAAAHKGFDLPPDEPQDDFDLATLVVRTKQTPLSLAEVEAQSTRLSPEKAQKEERRIHKLLRIDAQVEAKEEAHRATTVPEKMPGESKQAYRKRFRDETRKMLVETKLRAHGTKTKERTKEYLKNKKQRKKKGGVPSGANAADGNDDDDDDGVAQAEDTPRFGEQAQRPPNFRSLPRGAATQTRATSANHTKSSHKGDTNQAGTDGAKRKGKRKAASLDEEQVLAEQRAMEALRRKVQAQYALVRQKRRGEFHL